MPWTLHGHPLIKRFRWLFLSLVISAVLIGVAYSTLEQNGNNKAAHFLEREKSLEAPVSNSDTTKEKGNLQSQHTDDHDRYTINCKMALNCWMI
jgi:hypothetical protein